MTPRRRAALPRATPRAHRREACGVLAWVLAAVLAAAGCASVATSPAGDDYEEQVRRNATARDELRYGLTREQATEIMGEPQIVPPWANPRGLGPQRVANPMDRIELEAPNGDRYQVDRYAVGLWGEWRCPFVRGEAELVPLIYLDGRLVGWRWSYLESALERRLETDERSWSFGAFCGSETATQPPAEPAGAAPPDGGSHAEDPHASE